MLFWLPWILKIMAKSLWSFVFTDRKPLDSKYHENYIRWSLHIYNKTLSQKW